MTHRIGPYEILEELGQGGMGVVYRAWQDSLSRPIALKVLPAHVEGSPKDVVRFQREGKTAAKLKHDNIVAVYDAHVDDPPYYIAMELLEGRSLESIIADRGRIELREAIGIITQVFAGLDHAHSRDVIHRDIKPANIMIDASKKATITDFGIARTTDQTKVTATGATFGTPDYMSPEQAKGLPVDHRTDLYSAGVVLYEMLTGRTPFSGGSALTVMNRITTEPPPRPRGFDPTIPPGLEAVILKALEKDPRDRFQNGMEMVRALEAALREPETITYPHPSIPPSTPVSSAGTVGATSTGSASQSGVSPPDQHRRRRAALLVTALATVSVLIVMIAFVAIRGAGMPAVSAVSHGSSGWTGRNGGKTDPTWDSVLKDAYAQLGRKEYSTAIATAEKGIASFGERAEFYDVKSAGLWKLGKYAEAYEAAVNGTKADRDHADAWANRARTALKLGNREDAKFAADMVFSCSSRSLGAEIMAKAVQATLLQEHRAH